MSKLYVHIIINLFIISGLNAQDVTFGLKFGVNRTNVSSDLPSTQTQTPTPDSKETLGQGVSGQRKISEGVTLVIDL